ncbi:MAG TPA: hypothetical protein VKR58_11880 [Aquella sp.]|nr:hypothetical protein [Aquella sp.]
MEIEIKIENDDFKPGLKFKGRDINKGFTKIDYYNFEIDEWVSIGDFDIEELNRVLRAFNAI